MNIKKVSVSKKNIANDKGFTLVELIVVMCVMAIALTLGGFAMLAWQDWSTFNQENEYAQTLFVAAQNQLTEYSANGRLETLQSELGKEVTVEEVQKLVYGQKEKSGMVLNLKNEVMMDGEGKPYKENEIWVEAYKKNEAEREKYIDEVVAIRAEAGQYSNYTNDAEGLKDTDPEAYWVYEILSAYVYDESILNNAAICIEFTPDDGQVFAVLYSDKNDSFVYSTQENKDEGKRISNIENREEGYRNERMVGFYGVETLTKATRDRAQMAQVVINNVMLNNENTLNLTFDVEEGEVGSLDYKIEVLTGSNPNAANAAGAYTKKLEITIPAGSLQNSVKPVECDVAKINEDGTRGVSEKMNILCKEGKNYKTNKPQVVVILDAADLHAGANLYKDFLADGEAHTDVFEQTYSIFRFGIDIEYAKCEITASGTGYMDSETVSSRVRHMAFGTVNESTDNVVYTITNTRHFYNIRYILASENSGVNNAANIFTLKNGSDVNKFDDTDELEDLNADNDGTNVIDWGLFQRETNSYNRLYDSAIKAAGWETNALPTGLNDVKTCAFPSFGELDANDKIVCESGATYVLKNFTFNAEANVKYMNAKCFIDTKIKPVGLICENAGSIENITMQNVAVDGADYAGAFAGINNGSLTKLSVNNVEAKAITAKNYLGSITGMNNINGTVDMCQAIAGTIEGEKYIGGLVGYNKNIVKNTDSINLNNVATVRGLECVGGAVGYNDATATIDGLKFKCGLVDGHEQVGGVAGYNAGKIDAASTLISDISMTPNVTGDYYVGGIVGYNDSDATIAKYKVNKGTIVGREGSCFVGGYAGFNSSIYLLQDKITKAPLEIMSSPSKVTGSYYVGGCIGGNIINTNGYSNPVASDIPSDPSGPTNPETPEGPIGPDIPANGGNIPVSTPNNFQTWGANQLVFYIEVGPAIDSYDDWYIDFSALRECGNITINPNHGEYEVRDTYYVYPKSDWARNNVLNGSFGFTVSIQMDSGDNYNKAKEIILNDKISAHGLKNNNFAKVVNDVKFNNYLAFVGPTILLKQGDPDNNFGDDYDIDVVYQNDNNHGWTSNGRFWVNYVIDINNKTVNQYYGDKWYFTLVAPEGANIEGFSNCTYTKDGNTFNIVPNYYNTLDSNSINKNVWLQISFKSEPDSTQILAGGATLYVNGKPVASNGNLNPTPGDDPTPGPTVDVINASFSNSNYMGQLSGEAFVGGYVGYNMLVDSAEAGYVKTVSESYIDATKAADLDTKYKTVDELANTKPSDVEMRINSDKTSVVKNNIGVVSADICVGGVIGYNEADTNLVIYNTQNASHVMANKSIVNEDEQKINGVYRTTNYDNKEVGVAYYTYSYSGGIIGKVNTKTVINNCSNNTTALVSGLGTYTGGLAEINDGKIINCTILSFGDGLTDYVGGLCGLNEVNGHIFDCSCNSQTMSGRNVVGMVAAENYGEIRDITLVLPKMVVNGAYVSDGYKDCVTGIFAGYNGYTGDIKLDVDLVNIDVKASGRYVGGIVGINAGKISNGKVPPLEERTAADEDTYFINVTGRITGDKAVGGFIGANNNLDSLTPVEYLRNEAVVTASRGDVGGIIGMNNSANTIVHCQNNAIVTANNSGNAGGITSFNRGTIIECQTYRTVLSPKGMCGGIVAVNESLNSAEYPELGLIENCTVEPKETTEIVFTSSYSVGGVAAQNGGVIKNNILNNVKVTNTNDIDGSNMGVIVGENLATGRIYLPATQSVLNCKAVAESNECNIGGIAGVNKGVITSLANYLDSTNKEFAVINPNISLNGKANYGNMGGVAGKNISVGPNSGLISYIAVDASIKGKLGSNDTGYGGIAGCNISNDAVDTAKISYCTFDGFLNATGSAGTPARVGGITGVNGKNSIIEYCLIGQRSEDLANVASSHNLSGRYTLIVAGESAYKKYITYDRTSSITDSPDTNAVTYIGGYAGENFGTIYGGNNYSTLGDSEEVHIIGFLGDAGGIVGYNRSGAVVTGSKPDSITTVDKFTSDNKMADPQYDIYDPYNNILATGEKWYVDQLAIENDHGPGGIIAYNESSNTISYVDNHANVTAQFIANSHTGGIIGHSDTGDISVLKLSSCTNYGDVVSYRHLGGFIGETRTHSTSLENCINYGSVISETGCLAGFIGYVHTPGNHFTFNNCINHGEVSSKPGASSSSDVFAGGFLGRIVYARNLNFDFYNCVNTGVVKSARVNAGHFVGTFSVGANERINFDLCRNYNNYTNALNTVTTAGADGYFPTRKFVGSGGTVYIYNSFDNSNVIQKSDGKYPFKDGTGNASNNYYLDASSFASINANEFVKEGDLGVYFNFHMGNTAAFYVPISGDKGYTAVKDPSIYLMKPYLDTYMYTGNSSQELNRKPVFDFGLTYKPGDNIGVDAFTVFLGNSTRNATTALAAYNYELYATYYYLNDDGTYTEINTEPVTASVSATAMDYKRVDLPNPSPDNKQPVKIRINFIDCGNNVCLHGFGYIPTGKDEPYRCNYLGEKNNVYITLADATRYTKTNTVPSGGAIVFTDKDAKLGKNNYNSDYLNMEFLMYQNNDSNHAGYITLTSDYNKTAELTGARTELLFNVKNDKKFTDVEDFVFYLTTNNGKDVTCKYRVLFTDTDGNSMYCTDGTGNEVFDGVGKINSPENIDNNRQVIRKPDGLGYISEIKLILYPNSAQSVYLAGFGWIPADSNGREEKMAPDTMGTYSDLYKNPTPVINAYTKLNADLTTGNEVNGMTGHYYISHPINPSNGFFVDYVGNNPINNLTDAKGYKDFSLFDASLSAGRDSGSRVDLYYDIDPKITGLILKGIASNNVLSAPVFNPTVEENGAYKFSWTKVDGAAAYEVYYTYEAMEYNETTGTYDLVEHTVDPVDIGAAQNYYYIVPGNNWTKIKFYLKAVNAYSIMNGDTSYDSPIVSTEVEQVKQVLPVPEVHMETVFENYNNGIAKTNKLIAVLDNYEDYLVVDPVTGENKPLDCTINVYYNNADVDFSFDISEGRYYSTVKSLKEFGGDAEMRCTAVPNDSITDTYISSAMIQKFGRGSGNALFNSERYIDETFFNGFYGVTADDMKYEVYYKVKSGETKDAYMRTDISAYDERLGLNVVYDYEISHVSKAISAGEVIVTSTLDNIPTEWFGEDFVDDILVRSYPHRSQSNMVYFGHDVVIDETIAANLNAGGVISVDDSKTKFTLNENKSRDEIRTALSLINDDKYYDIYEDKFSAHPVMNGDELSRGYSLVKNDDDTYTLYYNSLIDSSIYQGIDNSTDDYPEYKRFNVAYRHYTEMKPEDYNENWYKTGHDYQERMFSNGLSVNQTATSISKSYSKDDRTQKKAEVYTNQFAQELQPAPILDGDIVANIDETGKVVFTVKWDKYFKDISRWDDGKKYYTDIVNKAYPDIADTWDVYVERIGYSSLINDNNRTLVLDNYYYMYAGRDAKYSLELIGYNDAGDSVSLWNETVDAASCLVDCGVIDDTALNIYTHKFDIPVEASYAGYAKYTVRITRLGEEASVLYELKEARDTDFILYNKSNTQYWKGKVHTGYELRNGGLGTFRLPRYIEKDINLRLPFDQMTKPTMAVHMIDENGTMVVDSTNLSYDLSFAAIDDVEQKADLGGYLITMKYVTPEGAEPKDDSYYYISYVNEFDEPIIDLSNADIPANITPTELTADSDAVLAVGEFVEETDNGSLKISALIELASVYAQGDELLVSVKPIAKLDAETYRDGEDSEATPITVYDRLEVPNVSNVSYDTSATSDNVIKNGTDDTEIEAWLVSEENHKLTVKFIDEVSSESEGVEPCKQYSDEDNVSVIMAIAVYDNPEFVDDDDNILIDTNDKSKVATSGDAVIDDGGNVTSTGTWDEGAYAVIYSKADVQPATYANGEYTIALDTDGDMPEKYAGMWLKIALKATSDTVIDSMWSDEDDDDLTINYMWIHLPELQVEDTTVGYVQVEDFSGTYDLVDSENGNVLHTYTYSGTQQALIVSIDDNADYYDLLFTKDDPENPTIVRVYRDETDSDKWYLLASDDSRTYIDTKTQIDSLKNEINVELKPAVLAGDGSVTKLAENITITANTYIRLGKYDLTEGKIINGDPTEGHQIIDVFIIDIPDILTWKVDDLASVEHSGSATAENGYYYINQFEAVAGLNEDTDRHKEYLYSADGVIWKREDAVSPFMLMDFDGLDDLDDLDDEINPLSVEEFEGDIPEDDDDDLGDGDNDDENVNPEENPVVDDTENPVVDPEDPFESSEEDNNGGPEVVTPVTPIAEPSEDEALGDDQDESGEVSTEENSDGE